MSTRILHLQFEASDDAESEFDTAAGILDALAVRFAWHPYLYGFFLTRAYDARKIEEYIQKNPQDTGLSGS